MSALLYADSACLLLVLLSLVAPGVTWLSPSRLGGSTKRLAPFLWAHIAPTGRAQANCLPFNRGRREFPARDVEHLQREIEQDLRRKSRLSHDAS